MHHVSKQVSKLSKRLLLRLLLHHGGGRRRQKTPLVPQYKTPRKMRVRERQKRASE
jgi:hypothetical protein